MYFFWRCELCISLNTFSSLRNLEAHLAQFRNSTVYKVTEFPLVKTKNAKMQALLKYLAIKYISQIDPQQFPQWVPLDPSTDFTTKWNKLRIIHICTYIGFWLNKPAKILTQTLSKRFWVWPSNSMIEFLPSFLLWHLLSECSG